MHPEVEEVRPKLKEILYDCAVELRATKAALYLLDVSIRRFELAAEYGFRSGIRQAADANDPLIERCLRGRTPFYVNGLTVDPRLSEMLFEASTERMLAVPLYMRGTLVGVIDMRDKAAKAPFENQDLPKAQSIGERILGLFANKNVFGQRFITLSDADPNELAAAAAMPGALKPGPPPRPAGGTAPSPSPAPSRPAAAPATAPPLAAPPLAAPAAAPAPPRQAPPVPQPAAPLPTGAVAGRAPVEISRRPTIVSLVADARTAVGRVMMPAHPDVIGDNELAAVRELLRAVLLLPDAVVVAFSATGTSGAVQEIASRGTMTEDALTSIQSKFQTWMTKRGESPGVMHTSLSTPLGLLMPPITPAQLQKVFTAPVAAAEIRGVYLTVAFAAAPERQTHELLATLLNQIQAAVEHSLLRAAYQKVRFRIAQKLLEPEFTRFPDLRHHTEAVTARVEAFAKYLALTPAEAETVKLTAIVHDVGMRLLDYDRLYRKRDISQEELEMLREHVSVGAAMVEPLLGVEIARGVLCHHERVDGGGYPNAIGGEDIPLPARILQICDAYVSMVDPSTYQMMESPEEALAALTRGAGSQFDAQLVKRFEEMLRGAKVPA